VLIVAANEGTLGGVANLDLPTVIQPAIGLAVRFNPPSDWLFQSWNLLLLPAYDDPTRPI
jgi:hypothetical protein